MSKRQLLVVDGDAQNLTVMEVSLRKAGFLVTTALNGADALARLEQGTPDLVLSDTRMEGLDGFELCRRMKADPRFAAVPFLFLSAQKTVEHKLRGLELGCDDYLAKPMYIREVVTRIKLLLNKRAKESLERSSVKEGPALSGKLSEMGIVDLVQTIELGRKSGVMRVELAGERAALYFSEGRIIDAELGPHRGEGAFFRLLNASEGSFELELGRPDRPERIATSTQGLLMEGMRRIDEWSRLCERLPPMTTVLVPDFALLAERLSAVPDELNPILRVVDGDRTLEQVVQASALDDLEVLKALVQLVEAHLLVALEEEPEPPAEPPGRDDPAIARASTPLTLAGLAAPSRPEAEPLAVPPPAEAPEKWFESP